MTSALGKDLLDLESLTSQQIRLILDTAEPFKEISERAIKKVPALRGSTIVNLFFENSTRTRICPTSPRQTVPSSGACVRSRRGHSHDGSPREVGRLAFEWGVG